MEKRQIILTQKQLDEICGNNSTYLDGLALTPDLADDYSNEITSNGKIEGAYPDPTTTDDFANDSTNNTRGYWGLRGMGSISTIREMSKKEWEEAILFNEENQRLKHRIFGASNNSDGKGYDATVKNIERYKKAANMAQTGSQKDKIKAKTTMQKMEKNWPGLEVAMNQYDNAKKIDKQLNPGIKSAPKNKMILATKPTAPT
jgi:hypothetical protein